MMRIGFALALVLELAGGCAAKGPKLAELTVDEVAARLHQPNLHVFDCNSRKQWAEGHVPTAKWVDYKNLQAGDLPSDKSATLIFYCQNEH